MNGIWKSQQMQDLKRYGYFVDGKWSGIIIYDLRPFIYEGSDAFSYHIFYSPSQSLTKSLRGEDADIRLFQCQEIDLAKFFAEAYCDHIHVGQTISHEKEVINLNGTVPFLVA